MASGRPHIAIVDPNVLATIGLRQLLQTVVPMMAVDVYPTFDAFLAGAVRAATTISWPSPWPWPTTFGLWTAAARPSC